LNEYTPGSKALTRQAWLTVLNLGLVWCGGQDARAKPVLG
jgi:hypothetical protein